MKKISTDALVSRVAKKLSAETKEEFHIIVESVYVEVTENTFEDGETGRSNLVFKHHNLRMVKTMPEVLQMLEKVTPLSAKDFFAYDGEDGRIEADVLVDEDNNPIIDDKQYMDAWKKGEKKAWTLRVIAHVKFVKTWSPSTDELIKAGVRRES